MPGRSEREDTALTDAQETKPPAALAGDADAFDTIYKDGLWGGKGGGSGPGSELSEMWPTVIYLAQFIATHRIERIVDLSCGAMAWWPTVIAMSQREVQFTGFDISDHAIARNTARLVSFPNMSFQQADALSCAIPACDLLICRETLNHLPIDHAQAILGRMSAADTRYFGATQNRFVAVNAADDARKTKLGATFRYTDWDLSKAPFNLPDPVAEIPENRGRSLAIYTPH